MNLALTIIVDGLIEASWLFIVALGLTLVFGVLKILNIAHGSFYALGAYVAATAVTMAAAKGLPPAASFVAMLLAAAFVAAAVGLMLERGLLKMFYGRDEVVLLLVTYAVFLLLEDLTKLIWGVNPIYATQPYDLFGNVSFGKLFYVGYDLVLIPIACLSGVAVWFGLNRTVTGKIVSAVIHNEEMSASMGVKVKRVYAFAFAFGVLLAAFAGALTAPKISVQPGLSSDVIILSFAIVVIGGLGSVEGAAVGAILVGLARATSVHLLPQAELFMIYLIMAAVLMFRPEGLFQRETARRILMRGGLHPVVMIALVIAAALSGRALPTWTLSLATVAASNALIALGIVVLARTGNVSFGQGLFFAAGGYGVALIANAWGITDAVAQVIIGAVCGGLLGLVIGPLIARYSGIFFGMLTLALSMMLYGALLKSTALGGSDGFNVGRPSLFGMVFADTREADFMLYAVSVAATGLAGMAATILFRSELGLASLAVRENNLRVEYLGLSANRIVTINFVIAAVFAGASGALALMAQRHIDPQFAYWTTSGEFVFVAVLAGYQSVAAVFVASVALELVRSFSNLYLPNTWQLVLGIFLLGVILFLPRGIGSLWIGDRHHNKKTAAPAPIAPEKGAVP